VIHNEFYLKKRRQKMNKHKRIGLGVLVAVILLLAMTIPVMAKKPYHFHITYDLPNVDWDNKSAEGTFTLQTNQYRSGLAAMSWTRNDNWRKGTMIFTNDESLYDAGSFTVKFIFPESRKDGTCGTGSFTGFEGTGEYAGYSSIGSIYICNVDNTILEGTLDGWLK
jgi:hypothetical protein